jgi:hypothetical protein
MVAMFEIASLIVLVVLGLWWFSRTNIYRAYRRSGVAPDQYGVSGEKFPEVRGPTPGPKERGSWHAPEKPEE